eukprot:7949400-Pyramimonas_sp.AAC.1
MQVVGFPCTPFSALNIQRFLSDYSPFDHKDCARGQGPRGPRQTVKRQGQAGMQWAGGQGHVGGGHPPAPGPLGPRP